MGREHALKHLQQHAAPAACAPSQAATICTHLMHAAALHCSGLACTLPPKPQTKC